MTPERWQTIEEWYRAVCDRDPAVRTAMLTGADPDIRREVESLLARHAVEGPLDGFAVDLVDHPAADIAAPTSGTANMRLEPGQALGSYTVIAAIGAGGMGEVYSARDARLDRLVAVKVLPRRFSSDPDRLARFKREARVLASLNHPNIAAIHGFEEHHDVQALVMEWVDGPTLADHIARGSLPVATALAIARQVAVACEAAHDQGIVHRDLKPANIKVRPDGTVKVLDFGLAKALAPSPADADLSAPTLTAPVGMVLGSAAYMSPEQARGQPVDRRTDVWAFGCVLYEMLTGKLAFVGENSADTLAAVVTAEPDWGMLPAGVPPTVRTFLRRCVQRDLRQRVHDIGDLRLALEGAFDSGPSVESPEHHPRSHWPRALAWVATVFVVTVATGFMVWRITGGVGERALTFIVHPPDGSRFERAAMHPFPAVSPDGRRLAFIAPFGPDMVLWVQAVGNLEATPLRGTEGAQLPFWSPDGEFIGFQAQGRLKKIAASGARAAQELCACDVTRGGSWSPGDAIVFAGSEGLFRVSADGGAPTPLTRVDRALGEFSHRYPHLLPDGTRFIYLVRSTREEHRGLYLGSLTDRTLKKRLIPDDVNGAYGAGPEGRGYLFFARDNTLLAQPFDVASGELEADPVVMARPLAPAPEGRLAPFAVGGRTLVYRWSVQPRTKIVWLDRRGVPQGSLGVGPENAEYSYPSLSPDGTKVAVAQRDPKTRKSDVWLFDLRRRVSERLTEDPVFAFIPAWMPDSRRIVFASARTGVWDLYSRAVSGSGDEEALFRASSPVIKYPRDITSDSRSLLFTDLTDLWLLPLDGERTPRRLLQGVDGRVSPDGRWLAYTSEGSGDRQVYVTSFPEPAERWRISTTGGQDPQWRRDGRELYYIAPDGWLMAVSLNPRGPTLEPGPPESLVRMSFDPQSLAFGSAYAPTPDGRRFLVAESVQSDDPLLAVTTNWTAGER